MGLVERISAAHGYDPERLGVARIRRACLRRTAALGLTEPAEYSRVLERDAGEPPRLFEELAVCETWFFRQHVALFAVARHLAGLARPVRVLSAPCATGEEPYSIAIALRDAGIAASDFAIDAVDLCDHALATARAGRYGRRAFRGDRGGIDPRYFAPVGAEEWVVREEIARTVRFARGDLRNGALLPAQRYHAVFCCHLFIYFGESARDLLAVNLAAWMAPEARLVVGPPEASALQQRGFVLVDPSGPVLARAPASAPTVPAPVDSERARLVPAGTLRGNGAPTEASVRTHLARARRLADAGHTPEAAAICRQLREIGVADSADLLCLVGVIELASGRRSDALAAFRRAAESDSAHTEARHFLAVLESTVPGAHR